MAGRPLHCRNGGAWRQTQQSGGCRNRAERAPGSVDMHAGRDAQDLPQASRDLKPGNQGGKRFAKHVIPRQRER